MEGIAQDALAKMLPHLPGETQLHLLEDGDPTSLLAHSHAGHSIKMPDDILQRAGTPQKASRRPTDLTSERTEGGTQGHLRAATLTIIEEAVIEEATIEEATIEEATFEITIQESLLHTIAATCTNPLVLNRLLEDGTMQTAPSLASNPNMPVDIAARLIDRLASAALQRKYGQYHGQGREHITSPAASSTPSPDRTGRTMTLQETWSMLKDVVVTIAEQEGWDEVRKNHDILVRLAREERPMPSALLYALLQTLGSRDLADAIADPQMEIVTGRTPLQILAIAHHARNPGAEKHKEDANPSDEETALAVLRAHISRHGSRTTALPTDAATMGAVKGVLSRAVESMPRGEKACALAILAHFCEEEAARQLAELAREPRPAPEHATLHAPDPERAISREGQAADNPWLETPPGVLVSLVAGAAQEAEASDFRIHLDAHMVEALLAHESLSAADRHLSQIIAAHDQITLTWPEQNRGSATAEHAGTSPVATTLTMISQLHASSQQQSIRPSSHRRHDAKARVDLVDILSIGDSRQPQNQTKRPTDKTAAAQKRAVESGVGGTGAGKKARNKRAIKSGAANSGTANSGTVKSEAPASLHRKAPARAAAKAETTGQEKHRHPAELSAAASAAAQIVKQRNPSAKEAQADILDACRRARLRTEMRADGSYRTALHVAAQLIAEGYLDPATAAEDPRDATTLADIIRTGLWPAGRQEDEASSGTPDAGSIPREQRLLLMEESFKAQLAGRRLPVGLIVSCLDDHRLTAEASIAAGTALRTLAAASEAAQRTRSGSSGVGDIWEAITQDHARALITACAQAETKDSIHVKRATYDIVQHLQEQLQRGAHPDILEEVGSTMPAQHLKAAGSSETYMIEAVTLAQRLPEDSEAWHTAAALLPTWEGTLNELADTVEALRS